MLGRFLQVDPAGTAGGVNLYAYVGNDPLNLLDPYGLAPDSPLQQFGNYLSESGAALARVPGDVANLASEFVSNAAQALQEAAPPALAGIGMSVPVPFAGAGARCSRSGCCRGTRDHLLVQGCRTSRAGGYPSNRRVS